MRLRIALTIAAALLTGAALLALPTAGAGDPQRGGGGGTGGGQRGGGGIGGQPPGTRGRSGVPTLGRGTRGRATSAEGIQQRFYLFKDTNEELEYNVFVSTKVKADKKAPLVIALHGLGMPLGPWMAKLTKAAQDAGVVMAAPMGYNLTGWYGADGPTSPRGTPPNLGELSEKDVMNVVDLVRGEFNIDDSRIYLVGNSMGGAGVIHLGAKYRTVWAAIAASAPAFRRQQNPESLETMRDMPVMFVHGDADAAIPVDQTRRWVAKAKELKMTVEYYEVKNGGHADAIVTAANRIFDFFKKYAKPSAD
jgi:predicted peptidase